MGKTPSAVEADGKGMLFKSEQCPGVPVETKGRALRKQKKRGRNKERENE